MEQFKQFFRYSQTLSVLGTILILFSLLDTMGAKFLGLNIKISFAVGVLGLYHILNAVAQAFDPDN